LPRSQPHSDAANTNPTQTRNAFADGNGQLCTTRRAEIKRTIDSLLLAILTASTRLAVRKENNKRFGLFYLQFFYDVLFGDAREELHVKPSEGNRR
jgi:hypothetical protein